MGMNLSLGTVTLFDGQRVTGDWSDALAMETRYRDVPVIPVWSA